MNKHPRCLVWNPLDLDTTKELEYCKGAATGASSCGNNTLELISSGSAVKSSASSSIKSAKVIPSTYSSASRRKARGSAATTTTTAAGRNAGTADRYCQERFACKGECLGQALSLGLALDLA